MKKYIKNIISVILIATTVFSFAGCKKETSPASSSSVSTSSSSASASSESSSAEDKSSTSSAATSSAETLTELKFNIGNDMGRSVSSLQIKPEKNNSWTDITLEKTWESGYMIPVTLSSKEIPSDEKWEAKIVYADDKTEQTFTDITITENSSVILTPDGIVYGK